jgi:hypothetical protein
LTRLIGTPTIPTGSPWFIAGVGTTYIMTPPNGARSTASVSPKKPVSTPSTLPAATACPSATAGYQIPVPGLRTTAVRSN